MVLSPNSPKDFAELTERVSKIRATGRSCASNEIAEGVSSQDIAIRDPDAVQDFPRGYFLSGKPFYGGLEGKIAILIDQMRTNPSIRMD